MSKDPDRPFGRDYPIIVGACPVCEDDVSTEFVDRDEDPGIKRWGDVYFHAACVPPDLKACGACGELEEVKRLDRQGNCWRCRAGSDDCSECNGTMEQHSPGCRWPE